MSDLEPQRKDWKRIPAGDIATIDAVLAKVNGNRQAAAIALGMTMDRLGDIIKNRPELQARWAKNPKEPVRPGSADEIHRGNEPMPMPEEYVNRVNALLKQDAILQQGWEKMGVRDKDRAFLSSLMFQYGANQRGVAALAFGGAAHATTSLLLIFEDIRRHIAEIDEHPDKFRRIQVNAAGVENETKGPHEYRREYYDAAVRVAGELRKMQNDLLETQKLQLVIAKMDAEQQLAEKKAKAGWVPGGKPVEATTSEVA